MKRILSICLVILVIVSLVGCGQDSSLKKAPNGVKIPEYTNLELTKTEYVVSEEFLNAVLSDVAKTYAVTEKIEEGVVAEGDIINISYTTFVGEQQLSEATLSNYTFTLCDSNMFENFEKALIGKTIGEEFQIEVEYPFNSTYSILDGKKVTHHVTIHYKNKVTYPEITDELIQTYLKDSTTPKEAACKTVAEYKAYLKERYELMYTTISDDELISKILDLLQEKAVFPEIKESELDEYVNSKYDYYIEYCEENGFTIGEYLSAEKITEAEFKAQLRTDGEDLIKKTMLVNAIKELEGITLTDEGYLEYLTYLMEYYQFDSIQAVKNEIATLKVEETVRNDATYDMVYQFLLKNQKITVEQKDLVDLFFAEEGA